LLRCCPRRLLLLLLLLLYVQIVGPMLFNIARDDGKGSASRDADTIIPTVIVLGTGRHLCLSQHAHCRTSARCVLLPFPTCTAALALSLQVRFKLIAATAADAV
jgi:hypothetical protein